MPTKQTNNDGHPEPADHGHQSALLPGGLRFRSLVVTVEKTPCLSLCL